MKREKGRQEGLLFLRPNVILSGLKQVLLPLLRRGPAISVKSLYEGNLFRLEHGDCSPTGVGGVGCFLE